MNSPHEVAPPPDPEPSSAPSGALPRRGVEATGRDVLAIVLSWLVCAAALFVVVFVATLLGLRLSFDQTSDGFKLFDFAWTLGIMIAGVWWRMRRRWTDAADWGFGHFRWSSVPIGIAVGSILSLISRLFDGSDLGFGGDGDAVTVAILFILAAIFTPVVEEIVFRRVLYGWLRHRFNVFAAIWGSALVFAAVHLHHGWGNAGFAALIGLALAWIVNREGTLWICVVAHMTINAVWVWALYAA